MKKVKYTINGKEYEVVINNFQDATAEVEVNGTSYTVEMENPEKKETPILSRPAQTVMPPAGGAAQSASASGALKSPLPGVIVDINCAVGDSVTKGQKLLVLEAMKMENAINADSDGVIKEIKVNKGDSVLEGDDLLVIG
jgi:Acetyl/propionyl-CoA carboxylase, alpha subunit